MNGAYSSGTPVGEPVRIRLLGGFQVSIGSRAIVEDGWRLKKAQTLTKLLALAPGHRLHREQITELLWPKSSPEAAGNGLRYALHNARRIFEPGLEGPSCYLHRRGNELLLCSEGQLWTDVQAFESAAAEAHRSREPAAYRAAAELYSGELLPEDRYEDWTQDRREELRQLYMALLVERAAAHEEREEIDSAIEVLEKLVTDERTHQEAHLGLMRLHSRNGRRHGAILQYEQLREALRRELDSEPDAVTQRLYREILDGESPGDHTSLTSRRPTVPATPSRHNLPDALSSFVGRERELLEVKRLLPMTRLLTLIGSGGCGKTRLALEVAGDLAGAYPDGVWLTELASLSDPALVPREVAGTLSVPEQPGRPPEDTLVDFLRHRQLLLVLDNCEHLIEACSRLAAILLASCPHLRVLATSREALGVAGEANWRVPPLSLPEAGASSSADVLANSESVRLFVERARSRLPTFALTHGNVRGVAEICWRLDGIPLAIELATARLTSLAVEQVAERLEDPLGLLNAGDRAAPPRQRTLRETLDWSYGLLDRGERELFERLSVFAGGFTLEAAESVGQKENGEANVLDLLGRLVEKSLVVAEPGSRVAARYRMLEPVRQYAREKLQAGGESEAARDRHAAWFLPISERTYPEMDGPGHGSWIQMLETEHDNLRAAMERCWKDGRNLEAGMRLAAGLFPFWVVRGYGTEGRTWLHRFLSSSEGREVSESARAKAITAAGILANCQSDHLEAVALSEESLALWRRLDDQVGMTNCLNGLCAARVLSVDYERGDPVCWESLTLSRRVGNRAGIVCSLMYLGVAAQGRGDHERARTFFCDCERACRELEMGRSVFAGWLMSHWSRSEAEEGDHASARSHAEKALEIGRSLDDTWGISLGLQALAKVERARGEDGRAGTMLAESLEGFRIVGRKREIAECLEAIASLDNGRECQKRAGRLLGASEALRRELGVPRPPGECAEYDHRVSTVRTQLGDTAWEVTRAEGSAMPLGEAIQYALRSVESSPSQIPAPEPSSPNRSPEGLSSREREVAIHVAHGLSNRQISAELVLSERTVETHVRNILRKLELRSRTRLASWVIEQRLLAEDTV